MHIPKGIDEAGIKQALETGSFLRGETVRPDILFGAGEVESRVCYVKIAATYHRFMLFECLEISEEANIPILAVGQATEVAFGIGNIHRDHKTRRKLHRQHAALAIVTFHTHIVTYGQGSSFRENRRAGVAPPLSPIPVLVGISRQIKKNLSGVYSGFLETEHIWSVRSQTGV